ncbi:MAG: CvpA family protein [Lachnospiraceae bacterium]|nr:CvpA family protein [Lachnospiraceae bacterium]
MTVDIVKLILYAVLILLIIWRTSACFKKGFAGELLNAFSMVIALFAGYFLYSIAVNYFAGKLGRIIGCLLYLSILLLIYKLIHLLLKALKLFAELPVVRGIDKLLGAVLGIVEGVLIMIALLTAWPILTDVDWVTIGENAYTGLYRLWKELPWKEWFEKTKVFFAEMF